MPSHEASDVPGGESAIGDPDGGNREAMTVTTPLSGTEVTIYAYDAANRLTYVGGAALTWDDNGNLLQDHEGTDYAYDTANRLTRVVQDGVTYTFGYNGTGDRLSQSAGGAVTTYTLDLYAGLTQVLGDGASVYLYGLGRIGEEGAAGWLYHLDDALGSVRQLADGDGEVVGDRSYRPYGGVLDGGGSGASAYGFAGEWTDGTGLVFLRARYMDPGVGRFLTRDPVRGKPQHPDTTHAYVYAGDHPIDLTDPSGLSYGRPGRGGAQDWMMLIPANLAVTLAKTSYLKIGPFARCFLYPDVQSSADTVADLFLDFVCEYGPSHRFFYADAFLTRQLARSISIHRLRMAFYQSGGATLENPDPGAEFGNLEFGLATVNSLPLWPIVGQPVWDFARSPFDITHFMGTYGYRINKVPGVDKARFEISNQTDLASGSRIPPLMGGVEVHDIDKLDAVYVEDLITDDPSLGSKHLAWIVQHHDVVSILHPRTRDETEGLQGGGTMRQTFIWYEAYPLLGCIRWLPPWPPAWINIEDYQGGDGGGGGASGFN